MLSLFPMFSMFPTFTIFASETMGPIYLETFQSLQLTNIMLKGISGFIQYGESLRVADVDESRWRRYKS